MCFEIKKCPNKSNQMKHLTKLCICNEFTLNRFLGDNLVRFFVVVDGILYVILESSTSHSDEFRSVQ